MSVVGAVVFNFCMYCKGYGPEGRCWVPSWDILDHTLIKDFLRTYPVPPVKTPDIRLGGGGTVSDLRVCIR